MQKFGNWFDYLWYGWVICSYWIAVFYQIFWNYTYQVSFWDLLIILFVSFDVLRIYKEPIRKFILSLKIRYVILVESIKNV